MNDWVTETAGEGRIQKIFRRAIVERARKRLVRAGPAEVEKGLWVLPGFPDLGDSREEYRVRLTGRHYTCDCYGRMWGEARERRICSHVVAVILWRRLRSAASGGLAPGGFNGASGGTSTLKGGACDVPLTLSDSALSEPTLSDSALSGPVARWLPAGLGLPAKFSHFRPVQEEALEKILASKRRWIFLQAPTGSGKSLIAAAVQRLTEGRMVYCCTTKSLQAQFTDDFPYAVELRGRQNYPTGRYGHMFPEVHCGLCTKTRDDPRCRWCCPPGCKGHPACVVKGKCVTGERDCPYEQQKRQALGADLAVLNTAMFLNEANYVGGFSGWPWVCLDEADVLEHELMSFVELEISPRLIQRLGLEPPRYKTKQEAWVEWAERVALPRVSEKISELVGPEWCGAKLSEIRELKSLERIREKLMFFLREINVGPWANCSRDAEKGPWIFKPVFVGRYANRYLWKHGERFLLMSATIVSKEQMCRNLGIPVDEADLIDLPSTFPKENRPVYYLPAANMTEKTKGEEWPRLVRVLDELLDRHPGEKVLVHAVSYALTRYVCANSRHRDRMVMYDAATRREEAIEAFKASSQPLVMVAPSLERGVDLVDDLCRVVVITKIPYRSLGDEQVRKRLYSAPDGQSWYTVDAIRTLIQMSGRAVRHERDWAVTYILDTQFGRLLKTWRHAFPRWWREALEVRTLDGMEVRTLDGD